MLLMRIILVVLVTMFVVLMRRRRYVVGIRLGRVERDALTAHGPWMVTVRRPDVARITRTAIGGRSASVNGNYHTV
jgi:hypothetical protein